MIGIFQLISASINLRGKISMAALQENEKKKPPFINLELSCFFSYWICSWKTNGESIELLNKNKCLCFQ